MSFDPRCLQVHWSFTERRNPEFPAEFKPLWSQSSGNNRVFFCVCGQFTSCPGSHSSHYSFSGPLSAHTSMSDCLRASISESVSTGSLCPQPADSPVVKKRTVPSPDTNTHSNNTHTHTHRHISGFTHTASLDWFFSPSFTETSRLTNNIWLGAEIEKRRCPRYITMERLWRPNWSHLVLCITWRAYD